MDSLPRLTVMYFPCILKANILLSSAVWRNFGPKAAISSISKGLNAA